MTWTLLRTYNISSTTGELLDTSGKHFCYTVERGKFDTEHPCIPEGTYAMKKYQSPIHGLVWELQNVPNRTFIEIHYCKDHVGNPLPYVRVSFLEGCIGLGYKHGRAQNEDAVYEAPQAFNDFMKATESSELEYIVIRKKDV